MTLLAEMASSLYKFLQFTHEVAQEGQMIPVLDMQVGVSKRESNGPWFSNEETEELLTPGKESPEEAEIEQVGYEFYAKPMANPLVILARSAIPEGTKVATMASEIK